MTSFVLPINSTAMTDFTYDSSVGAAITSLQDKLYLCGSNYGFLAEIVIAF